MTETEALEAIRGMARAGRYSLSRHARTEMYEAKATEEDVREAMINAKSIRPTEKGRWRIKGPDLDGDELEVVIAIEDQLIIVTVI